MIAINIAIVVKELLVVFAFFGVDNDLDGNHSPKTANGGGTRWPKHPMANL